MIVEAFENYARFNGAWLQGWTDMNSAAVASARMAFGQLELAALTSRFMTQRIRVWRVGEDIHANIPRSVVKPPPIINHQPTVPPPDAEERQLAISR